MNRPGIKSFVYLKKRKLHINFDLRLSRTCTVQSIRIYIVSIVDKISINMFTYL